MMRRTAILPRLRPVSAFRSPALSLARARRAIQTLHFTALLLPVLLVAAALRLVGIGSYDLSLDEAISHYIINRPFLDIIAYCFSHAYEHPPTYYLAINLWTRLAGSSEFALRAFSAFAGVLNVAALAALARRWFGRQVALLAALLLAVWPLALQQGREARMYPLLSLAALLAVFAFDRAIDRNRWRDWALFLTLFVFALSIHYLVGLSAGAFALLYLLWWRKRPKLRPRFGVVLLLLIGLPLLVLGLAPGPRESVRVFVDYAMRSPWSPGRLVPIYAGWVLGVFAEMWPVGAAVAAATIPWALFVFGLSSPLVDARRRQARLVLLLLVLAPALVGTLVFFFVAPRHHSAFSGLFVLGVALGLHRLGRRKPAVGALFGLALLLGSLLLAGQQPTNLGRSFSEPLRYAEERSRPGEPLIFTYFFDRYQRDYYTRTGLPSYYIGNQNHILYPEQADQRVSAAIKDAPSAWLILRPDEYNPEEVERALNEQMYAGEKTWFEGGRAVVHYFRQLPRTAHEAGQSWDAGVLLNRWSSSSTVVPAGDALRLDLEWRRTGEIEEPLLVGLALTDETGRVWAQRLGAPCNGLCPTTEWGAEPFVERQALEIPADTPPGRYTLHIYWLRSDGSPVLGQPRPDDPLRQERIELHTVEVGPPQEPAPGAPPLPLVLDAPVRPGLVLRSAGNLPGVLAAGANLSLPLQWQVTAAQPSLDVQLRLSGPAELTTVGQPLGTADHPTSAWTPGRLIRTQPAFVVPGALGAGRYEASLVITESGKGETAVIVPLGPLELTERPRRFSLPDAGRPVDAEWQQGVRLARIDLPAMAQPGTELPLSLIWQAGGPTDRNWKVFIHLADETGEVRAQGDAFPINGADGPAPTSTWRAGEVIVDDHRIDLPPELPPGRYTLRVGLYEEGSNQRLPLAGGGDTLTLPFPLEVLAPGTGAPQVGTP